MGFCMGVRRAVQIMEHEATLAVPVYSVGEIVHNPHVVASLERNGVHQLPGPDDMDGGIGIATARRVGQGRVAITAHGVGPQVLHELEARGAEIVDTTCPIVTRAQQWAKKLTDEGFGVIVFGDPDHKEVRGILGWANGKVVTMRSADGHIQTYRFTPNTTVVTHGTHQSITTAPHFTINDKVVVVGTIEGGSGAWIGFSRIDG